MAKNKKKPAKPRRAAKPARVTPVPEGFTAVTPHLVVGDGDAALAFYQKAFAAKLRDHMKMPDGSFMHASLRIGDAMIMLGQECIERGLRSPKSLGGNATVIHLYVADADKAFARAVAAGSTVKMPVTDMFWGDRYGQVVDPFGHSWSIAARKRKLTAAQMRKAGKEAMAQMAQGGQPPA